jgi:hypothetical protein
MKMAVFWVVASIMVLMMEAVSNSETSANFLFNPILSFLRVYFQTNFLTSIQ